ncbi:MAG: hypothetical protein HY549_08135 [Elusimicrobia bacterium]|nr:hypothetical protein [Elusimicrobiota bacterium]
MKFRTIFTCTPLLGALALGGCVTFSAQDLEQASMAEGAAAVVIAFRGAGFPSFLTHYADSVVFASINSRGQLERERFLRSNFTAGRVVYLLNAPPGRYAPIYASYRFGRARYLAQIDDKTALDWSGQVSANRITFLGANEFTTVWRGGLAMLSNSLRHIGGSMPPFRRKTIRIEVVSPKGLRSPVEESAVLRASREYLSGSYWAELAGRRLRELGNPPEPIFVGRLFKKPAPRISAGSFSYIDTLKWGAGRKIEGGLEWREPKGRARILVHLVVPGSPGYKEKDEYIRHMRSAGGPEDDHVLGEIVISSRAAHSVRYTTYQYPPTELVGSRVTVLRSETVMVPEEEGYFLLHYRTERRYFQRFLPEFHRFIQYLNFHAKQEKKA